MKSGMGIFLIFGLIVGSIYPASVKKQPSEIEQVASVFNEISYYFGSTLQFYMALKCFSQKYNTNTPEITCKFCPSRPLPCDELLVKIQTKAIDKAIGANDPIANEARKKMLTIYEEITKLLYSESIDNIRKFMAKAAQEEEIQCEDCQKNAWMAVGINKSTK